MQSHYAASTALRRTRAVAPIMAEDPVGRCVQPAPPTPYRLYFSLAMALVLSTAYAFPDQAAWLLRGLGAI